MIRVVLPAHLRTLARVTGEVELEVAGEVDAAAVLDALEAAYPVLRGTIRDQVTGAAAAVRAIFRLRRRFIARLAGFTPARGGVFGGGAAFDRRRHRRRLAPVSTAPVAHASACRRDF